MRALPVPAEALPQAPPGGMFPRTPSDFYVALEVCSRSGMDEWSGFFNGFALMGNAGQPCIKTWEHGRAGAWGRGEVRGCSRFQEEASPFPRTSAQKSFALI